MLGVAGRGGSASCSVPAGVVAFTRVCEGIGVAVNVACIFQADSRMMFIKVAARQLRCGVVELSMIRIKSPDQSIIV